MRSTEVNIQTPEMCLESKMSLLELATDRNQSPSGLGD